MDSVLRNADSDTWYGDIDLGEMFLNYFLDEKLRPYARVNVSGSRELLHSLTTFALEIQVVKTLVIMSLM